MFAKTNSAITLFKLVVPAAAAIALIMTSRGELQVGANGGTHAVSLSAILTAVAISGIVFLQRIQSPVNLAGEARATRGAAYRSGCISSISAG